ncbi:MAG TPA: hypothetical protein VLE54_08695 [Thermoanaerobaculia bacterium]|nr:hypothetical protein [Thermoanaerobaculia bacterium]
MRRFTGFLVGVGLALMAVPVTSVAQEDEAEAKELMRQQSLGGIRTQAALVAPVFRTISGTPLTIYVADDASFQVLNANVPGSGQFYPSGGTCTPGDAGVFADSGGILYAPNFGMHPCGSATESIGTNTPWTPVSISAVTGSGTSGSPFTVVVVVDAGTTGLRLTMTVTYVNGDGFFNVSNVFTTTGSAATADVFFGADLYLANNDDGIPFRDGTTGGVGGQNCGTTQTYTIQFIPTTAADAYAANGYSSVWQQIGDDALGNTVTAGCLDNGAALEWTDRAVNPGAPTTINVRVQFTGFVGPSPTPTGPAAVVPTLSFPMMALFAAALATLGFVFMRRN